jgi:hypothetical protein
MDCFPPRYARGRNDDAGKWVIYKWNDYIIDDTYLGLSNGFSVPS